MFACRIFFTFHRRPIPQILRAHMYLSTLSMVDLSISTQGSEAEMEVVDYPWLTNWDVGTLNDRSRFDEASEIYQLGKVLEEFENLIHSSEGKNLVLMLKTKQLTALQALKHPW